MKTASIIIIGNEILSGRTQDTNSNYLAKMLVERGISLQEIRVIPDDHRIIEDVVYKEASAKDYVFTSGGIGPTHDDITAEAVASCFDVPLSVRDDAVKLLAMNYKNGVKDLNEARLRMARIQVLIANAKAQVSKLIRPHAVVVSYYNQKPIPENVAESVMGFFFLYIISFAVIASLLGGLGLDFITAISGAASAIGNVGPGLGDIIGPSGSYQSIPDLGKLILCAGMILGRLEIFAILVMFSPLFWKN